MRNSSNWNLVKLLSSFPPCGIRILELMKIFCVHARDIYLLMLKLFIPYASDLRCTRKYLEWPGRMRSCEYSCYAILVACALVSFSPGI